MNIKKLYFNSTFHAKIQPKVFQITTVVIKILYKEMFFFFFNLVYKNFTDLHKALINPIQNL